MCGRISRVQCLVVSCFLIMSYSAVQCKVVQCSALEYRAGCSIAVESGDMEGGWVGWEAPPYSSSVSGPGADFAPLAWPLHCTRARPLLAHQRQGLSCTRERHLLHQYIHLTPSTLNPYYPIVKSIA